MNRFVRARPRAGGLNPPGAASEPGFPPLSVPAQCSLCATVTVTPGRYYQLNSESPAVVIRLNDHDPGMMRH